MGRGDLVVPMLLGVSAAMLLDSYVLYRLFDYRIFPASGAWPLGVAAAGVISAGDKGGRQGKLLLGGIVLGALGSFCGLSMSAFGIAFLGNIWALSMFGVSLLTKTYANSLAALDITALYLPHGFMVGAGLVALLQVILTLRGRGVKGESRLADEGIGVALGIGGAGYIIIAIFLSFATGIYAGMGLPQLLGFIFYAAFAAFVHELIVGIAAMHSGWFPAFAVALITLLVGMLLGFPLEALMVLAAYSAATGPAFADMGYDLKAGFILRNNGANLEWELYGRRAQLIAAMMAFIIAVPVVYYFYDDYFSRDLVPPVARVYANTIVAGTSFEVARQLMIWAIPGALVCNF